MAFSRKSLGWLKLLSVRNIRGKEWMILRKRFSIRQLVEMAGSRDGIDELSKLAGRRIPGIDNRFVDRHMEAESKNMLQAVCIEEDPYPSLLREIQDAPPLIFYMGGIPGDDRLKIAVVGSRSAGRRGLLNAGRIAEELSDLGVTVVSGLARGVDTEAHLGALKRAGGTVAVTGCGLDVPYPPENSGLSLDIIRNGCVMTEYPLGTSPLKHHFPRRNRILSGLSEGVVIVEAGIKSGAMITARWAADQGREVFAVPGPVEYHGSAGPHRLIKEGAVLVESAEDIIGFLDPFRFSARMESGRKRFDIEALSETEKKVMMLLELEPVHIDTLSRELDSPTEELMVILLNLEIGGYCRSLGGGVFAAEPGYCSRNRI